MHKGQFLSVTQKWNILGGLTFWVRYRCWRHGELRTDTTIRCWQNTFHSAPTPARSDPHKCCPVFPKEHRHVIRGHTTAETKKNFAVSFWRKAPDRHTDWLAQNHRDTWTPRLVMSVCRFNSDWQLHRRFRFNTSCSHRGVHQRGVQRHLRGSRLGRRNLWSLLLRNEYRHCASRVKLQISQKTQKLWNTGER